MKRKASTLILTLLLIVSCSEKENLISVNSPDRDVVLTFVNNEGQLNYSLSWQGQEMITNSKLSILPNLPVEIISSTIHTRDTSWQTVWGQFSEIRDHYKELVLDLKIDGINAKLFVRAYNQGIGFRFELDESKMVTLFCEYKLSSKDAIYCTAGENPPLGPLLIDELLVAKESEKLKLPIVVEKSNSKYLSILESDLYSAKGFETMNVEFDKTSGSISSQNTSTSEITVSPWRVILLGESAGDLLTNTVALNLAAPCQLENTSWIKPGKTLWDWRVHGYTAPDGFTYGIDTESYLRFIDFAAEKGIDYFLIDDAWYKKVTKGHFELSDKLDLQKVIDYAAKKEVELLLYYDRRHGDFGDDELFAYYQSIGMKGIKYGFMGEDEAFSRKAILESSKHELLINFHDSPVPLTGISRTLPNAITREYCHAQQDSRKAFTPETFLKMAFINALQGPLDMNNGNFDLEGINNGERQKCPLIKNSYPSTVVSEVARTLIIFSGLVCIPDAPEAYEAKADLFEFIQKMPVGKWDETRILNSKIGKHITTARRHNDEWFVASAIDQQGGELKLSFDFLKEGVNYDITYYEDAPDTHCTTNPEAYQIRQSVVNNGDTITMKMAPGGGHCMWIKEQ